jgi:hypothetical protein
VPRLQIRIDCSELSLNDYIAIYHLTALLTLVLVFELVFASLNRLLPMADTEAIAAAIAKVKSKKSKKVTAKTAKAGAGEGRATNGRGRSGAATKVAGAGTAKRGSQGASIRASIAQPGVPVVQHRAGVVKQRVIPTGQKLKYVFDLVKSRRKPLKYEVFKKEKDVEIDEPLLEALRKHALMLVDEVAGTISYQPKYSISSKQELLTLIKRSPLGLLSIELSDAYPEAQQHLNELYEDGAVFECGSTERPSSIIYPNLFKSPGALPEASLRDALFDVQLPQRQEDIDAALRKENIKKAKRSTPRLKMAVIHDDRKPVKERKQRRLRKVTNTHMEYLFNEDMPATIDG